MNTTNPAQSPLTHVPANLARRLSEGVGSWMHFEYLCRRSGLFNEHYLTVPVGQILSAVFGERVHSEFEHPILGPLMKGSGRRPSLDFVYCDPYPEIRVAVETKWAGSKHATVENIVWDLLRLELIANRFGAVCIFLLAGKRSALIDLFNDRDFAGPPHTPGRAPILREKSNGMSKLSLLPDKPSRIPMLRSVFIRCQDIPVPHALYTRRAEPFPSECRGKNFQVFAWEVISAPDRQEFVPRENPYFAVSR
jgi:hypothetical protein